VLFLSTKIVFAGRSPYLKAEKVEGIVVALLFAFLNPVMKKESPK